MSCSNVSLYLELCFCLQSNNHSPQPACQSVLGQDAEPQIAVPWVYECVWMFILFLVGTWHLAWRPPPSVYECVWKGWMCWVVEYRYRPFTILCHYTAIQYANIVINYWIAQYSIPIIYYVILLYLAKYLLLLSVFNYRFTRIINKREKLICGTV